MTPVIKESVQKSGVMAWPKTALRQLVELLAWPVGWRRSYGGVVGGWKKDCNYIGNNPAK